MIYISQAALSTAVPSSPDEGAIRLSRKMPTPHERQAAARTRNSSVASAAL
jgi:hypothetical protein